MSNQTSNHQSHGRGGALRRSIAGLAAAGAIAFGGVGTLSAAEAEAAGVRQQVHVVQASTGPVPTNVVPGNPRGKD